MDTLLRNDEFMKKLHNPSQELATNYARALPYPHAVFDDFFPVEILDQVLHHFPQPKQVKWQSFDNGNEKKLAFRQAELLPTPIREFLYFLNSYPVLQFLEKVTGIVGLIPDPSFSGGGCHQIERGGKLQVHVDFNKIQPTNLDRRVNLLVYLNKNWKEEYGGNLELWDSEGKVSVKQVAPLFNRCVIFSTTETSYHGHPHPLTCPDAWTRKSIALYYYSNGRDDQVTAGAHSTVFLGDTAGKRERRGLKGVMKLITPPVLWQIGQRLKPPFNRS
jgi:Rps23 Pro-64 3,4-dihydroxylase Tpa1-like proline 4-hydroxylase